MVLPLVAVPAASSSSSGRGMDVDVAVVGAGPAGLAAAAALRIADPSLRVHVFEKTNMTARGAAVLVGVNGLLALEAIGGGMVDKLLDKAITLEGSGTANWACCWSHLLLSKVIAVPVAEDLTHCGQ